MGRTEERYAIYYAPEPESNLAKFGAEWLGVDAERKWVGEAPSSYVDAPRRYGFHATLKAPMRLHENVTYKKLRDTAERTANSLQPVQLGKLKLKRLGNFLALTTARDHRKAAADLAWDCVRSFEYLRAPLNAEERAKRKNLTNSQRRNLELWGYPYVHKDFRFHMTLTSPLCEKELTEAEALVRDQLPSERITLSSICIFRDPGDFKPFELVERFQLRG